MCGFCSFLVPVHTKHNGETELKLVRDVDGWLDGWMDGCLVVSVLLECICIFLKYFIINILF